MSKIAEKKALEIYPDIEINWTMTDRTKERMIYADGYNQAMQDFLEKAEKWLEDTQIENFICRDDGIYFENEKFLEQFKNYMKNESEN